MQYKMSIKWEDEIAGNISIIPLAFYGKHNLSRGPGKRISGKNVVKFLSYSGENSKDKTFKGEWRNIVHRTSNKDDNLNVDYQVNNWHELISQCSS